MSTTKYFTEGQMLATAREFYSKGLNEKVVIPHEYLATLTPIEAPIFTEEERKIIAEDLINSLEGNHAPIGNDLARHTILAKLTPQPTTTPWTAKDFFGYLAEHGMEGVEVKGQGDEEYHPVFAMRDVGVMLHWGATHPFKYVTNIRHQDPHGKWVETECRKEQK